MEYEESKKTLEEEVVKLRRVSNLLINCINLLFVCNAQCNAFFFVLSPAKFTMCNFVCCLATSQNAIDSQKGVVVGRHAEGALGLAQAEERHTVATHQRDSPDLKGTSCGS